MPASYTGYAKWFANRFPTFSYLLAQVVFWIIAYTFLTVLVHLTLLIPGPALHADINFTATLIIALYFGLATGIVSGFTDKLFEKRLFHNKSLGIVIIGKVVIHFFVFVILISVVRYSFYPLLQRKFFSTTAVSTLQQSWDSFFQLLFIFNIVTAILVSFINQVNKKFGPGVLLPLLLGKYRKPKEEERIFLFMDLKSSVTLAETLGHLKYSAFIRDSFMDINAVLAPYNAQVYQYVGDAMVITWTKKEGLHQLFCFEFFFACTERFSRRSGYYLQHYGQTPEFKAGIHLGKVMAVEVGEIKRDIAYHGDALNTAARIQSVCNEFNQQFLASEEMIQQSNATGQYTIEPLGGITLKGKSQAIEIVAVHQISSSEKQTI